MPGCVTVVGCLPTAGLGGLGGLSFSNAYDSAGAITGPYVSTEGDRVLSSFHPENNTPENSAMTALGRNAAQSVAEALLLRGTGKLLAAEYGVAGKGVPAFKDEAKGSGQTVVRSDDDFNATTNGIGKPKAYINESGDLVPPNINGTGSIQTHVRGGNPENSPYISVTDPTATRNPKSYGTDNVEIDVKRLQQDIDCGALPDTKFLTHQQVAEELQSKVDAARVRHTNNPTPNNADSLTNAIRDLRNATRDGECLIMGCVPAAYIKRIEK